MSLLCLLRHAQADRGRTGLADIDRPLTPEGVGQAVGLAARMRNAGISPTLVLCSTARRTRETWHALAAGLDGGTETRFTADLYRGDLATYLSLIEAVPAAPCLLVVGHNPMVGEWARLLAGEGVRELPAQYPVCGLVVFDVTAPAAGTRAQTARLKLFIDGGR